MLNGYPVFTPSEMMPVFSRVLKFPDASAIQVLKQRHIRFVVIDQMEMALASRTYSPEAFADELESCDEIRKVPAACDDRFLLYEILEPPQ